MREEAEMSGKVEVVAGVPEQSRNGAGAREAVELVEAGDPGD